jgi:hypothetical protein
MSENLMDNVAPEMSPPVTREPIQSASESGEGANVSFVAIGVFADD